MIRRDKPSQLTKMAYLYKVQKSDFFVSLEKKHGKLIKYYDTFPFRYSGLH